MTTKEKKTEKTEQASKGVKKGRTVADNAREAAPKKNGPTMAEAPIPTATAKTEKKARTAKKASVPGTDEILAEVRGIKDMVGKLLPSADNPDTVIDASADALRRLLSDLIERRLESVIKQVAEVRSEVPVSKFPEAEPLATRLDTLLGDLGAIRYEAEPLDYIDPLIHNVVGERRVENTPDGVILETVRPGYRTARGLIVAKAAVLVNRSA
jgi:molecular chaperone GrpE (heat shock protein)